MKYSMKNKFNTGIALAISFFVLSACFSNSLYAQLAITQQAACFTITLVHGDTIAIGPGCDTNQVCGPNAFDVQLCTRCIDVQICCNKCPGLDPTTFIVTSNSGTDCHGVCSPNGDFHKDPDPNDPGPKCSWYNPRTLIDNNINGIQDGNCTTIRICHRNDGQTYHIKLPAGTMCGTTPCTGAGTDAIITF